MTKTAEELRAEAKTKFKAADDSFERCDTDGFLSQWASNLTGRKLMLEAEIAENDGLGEFMALADADGNLVPAKVIDAKYGRCWAILSDWDWKAPFTGEFIGLRQVEKKGYRKVRALAPARAEIVGSGTGLAGAASCQAVKVQTGLPVRIVEREE